MEEVQDWKRFAVSGKVEDYLRYKGVFESAPESKENSDAGFRASDRDGHQGDSCR